MEKINGREYFRLHFAEYVAKVLGPDIDPDSLSPADIRALPTTKVLEHPPFRPESDSEAMPSFGLKRLAPEETLERMWRSERFLKMPEVHFPAEEELA
jgi:hypothetical protein